MKPGEIRKLLGGYATGTLTGAEREALMRAALEDQDLFNALAEEERLREMLDDPAWRRELAASLREPGRPPLASRLAAWWMRSWPLAAAGAVAALVLAAVIVRQMAPPATDYLAQAPPLESASGTAPAAAVPAEERDEAKGGEPARRETTPSPAAPPSGMGQKAEVPAEAPPAVGNEAEPRAGAAAGTPARPRVDFAAEAQRQPAEGEAGVAVEEKTADRPGRAAPAPPAVAAMREGLAKSSLAARSRGSGVLAWQLERRGPGGVFQPADPSLPLELSDAVRFRVTAPAAGEVALFEIRESGSRERLAGVEAPGGVCYLPAEGVVPAPKRPGVRRLIILFAGREPAAARLAIAEEPAVPEPTEITLHYR
jgi:hypothetical protein